MELGHFAGPNGSGLHESGHQHRPRHRAPSHFRSVWNGAPNGIPYVVVTADQPLVPILFQYADESDPGPYPIPVDAPVEGGPSSTGVATAPQAAEEIVLESIVTE